MNAPVYWKVIDVQDNGKRIIIEFKLNTTTNQISYRWDGDVNNLIRFAHNQAKYYENEWQLPAPSYDQIQSILNLSGSSFDELQSFDQNNIVIEPL